MSVAWMWGWELGATTLTHQQTGWLFLASTTNGSVADPSPFQPASGFGGGRFNYRASYQWGGTFIVQTPTTGKNSLGTHSRFIFHGAYRRNGVTAISENRRFFGFRLGTTVVIELGHTAQSLAAAPMELRINGVVVATTTTIYTGTQPYHRIVFDMDGPNGNYNIYINGILEMSVVGSAQTFAAIDSVEFLPGVHATFLAAPSIVGGSHDHEVLFDAGNHSTGTLTLAVVPTDGDLVTVGGQTYTFKTVLTPLADEVLIGVTAALSRENLINAINLGPGAGTTYANATTLNAIVKAEEDLANTAVFVEAKLKGIETSPTLSALTAVTDGWFAFSLAGGDLDPTNDLALALGQIFIQGLRPNNDVADGAWLNVNGPNAGTNVDLFNNVNDGQNLTDFIETTTLGDEHSFAQEVRADISGTAASGILTSVVTPTNGETVTIGGKTYTFQTALTDVDGNVLIAGTNILTIENLRRAVNLDGLAGTNYALSMTAHPSVSASDDGAGNLTATAKVPGSAGNSIVTTETGVNMSWANPTLTGGVENWLPSEVHYIQSIQIARGSGAITGGRTTVEVPSLGKVVSDLIPVTAAGQLHNTLRSWRGGNVTTDLDGIKSGFKV